MTPTPTRRIHRLATAAALASTLLLGAVAVAPAAQAAPVPPTRTASAQPTGTTPAAGLVGTWRGTYSGYYDGDYVTGQQRYKVTKAKGMSAKGTWQFRESAGDPWSAPKPVQLTVLGHHGEVSVYGADNSGVYAGELDGDSLTMTYSEYGKKPQTLFFALTRA